MIFQVSTEIYGIMNGLASYKFKCGSGNGSCLCLQTYNYDLKLYLLEFNFRQVEELLMS